MKTFSLTLILVLLFTKTFSQMSEKITVYLIPGQGADSRLFNNLKLDDRFAPQYIRWVRPQRKTDLPAFARLIAQQIDTSKSFCIVGVSLGGMVASEISDFLNPKKIIVISSAKSCHELPGRYKFMRVIPINKIIPGFIMKAGSFIAQPLFEPDRKKEKPTFKAMLKAIDPVFLKRTVNMIINWKRETYDPDIYHIHGEIDHTLPIKKVNCDLEIKGGSHMMTLTRGDELSPIINEVLLKAIE